MSDFTSDYKIDGQDGNFENNASNVPHTSGKNTLFDRLFIIHQVHVFSCVSLQKFGCCKIGTLIIGF